MVSSNYISLSFRQKLLNDKGFGVKEQIHLQSSMCPDSISNRLETMLRIGRIIHLDEVNCNSKMHIFYT